MASDRSLEDVERWALPNAGLALFLNALRGRVALLILVSAGTLAARAAAIAAWPKFAAPATAALAAAIGAAMIVGFARHLRHPRGAGGVSGGVGVICLGVALVLDAGSLALTAGVTSPPAQIAALTPLSVALLAELAAFVALAPVALSGARLAAALGANDVKRRAFRAAGLVAFTAICLAALIWFWTRLPERFAVGLASGAGLLVVLALAKLLGALRFLLAYVRTMHVVPSRPSGLELRAWHRA